MLLTLYRGQDAPVQQSMQFKRQILQRLGTPGQELTFLLKTMR